MENSSEYYFAPMEGVTNHHFRRIHHLFFPESDRYYSPFLSPVPESPLTPKERAEVDPCNNEGFTLIPQILTNRADMFLSASEKLTDLGYSLINLNLGCPSGTVTAKKRGAGFLTDPEALASFFDEIFRQQPDIRLSVKTRLGFRSPEEFEALVNIYLDFPIEEIILHPRTGVQMYNGLAAKEAYAQLRQMVADSPRSPRLVMNGDLFTVSDVNDFCRTIGADDALMFGRGFVANPALVREIKTGNALTLFEFKQFHKAMYADVKERMGGNERIILFAMKEYWYYWSRLFEKPEKTAKSICKCNRLADYDSAVQNIYASGSFDSHRVHFFHP